jgi:hypothetical protein
VAEVLLLCLEDEVAAQKPPPVRFVKLQFAHAGPDGNKVVRFAIFGDVADGDVREQFARGAMRCARTRPTRGRRRRLELTSSPLTTPSLCTDSSTWNERDLPSIP